MLLTVSALACRTGPGDRPFSGSDGGRTSPFLAAPQGPADAAVRQALAAATSAGKTLLVYEGATWCEPCQRFHHAAADGELDSTLSGVLFLEFDADRDGSRLASAGYASTYIPLFAVPNADGTGSGRQIEGGIKGNGAVAQLVPRLRRLLGR